LTQSDLGRTLLTMRQTYTAATVARKLLERPADKYWGTMLQQLLHMPPGTLYPILGRFRNAGWLKAQWEDPAEARAAHTGPPRRYYLVTDAGVIGLQAFVDQWDNTRGTKV
jgi:DNA-binding PadR family transcriptional regulator